MIKRLLALILLATLISPVAYSATQTPKAVASKKATPVSTAKAATPSTKKATISKTPVAKKPVAKKKVVTKRKPKKKINLSPSPSPKWPPAGYKSNGEVFAKIPTAKELISTASNSAILSRQLAQLADGVRICEKFSCGAVQLASLNGCTWWDISGKLVGETSAEDKTIRTFGTIRVLIKSSAPKQIVTVLLVSQELLALGHSVTGIEANCHHDATSEKIPSTVYTSIGN